MEGYDGPRCGRSICSICAGKDGYEIMSRCVCPRHQHGTNEEESEKQANQVKATDDCSKWTIDDCILSEDGKKVISICQVSCTKITVIKLRVFAKTLSGLQAGYSTATKGALLEILANRKNGAIYAAQMKIAIENKSDPSADHGTRSYYRQRRGLKPENIANVGTTLRFVNVYFEQCMRQKILSLKESLPLAELDKRSKMPREAVWEAIAEFYNSEEECLSTIPTSLGKWSVFEDFGVTEDSPTTFESLQAGDLFLLYHFIVNRKFVESQRKFKLSGNHDDFNKFIGGDSVYSPALYYYYLRLMESGDPNLVTQATNGLPPGVMADSSGTTASEAYSGGKQHKRGKSPSNIADSQRAIAEAMASMGEQKKRQNERLDAVEKDSTKVRKMAMEKQSNEQFVYLLETNQSLEVQKNSMTDVTMKRAIQTMIDRNKASIAEITREEPTGEDQNDTNRQLAYDK